MHKIEKKNRDYIFSLRLNKNHNNLIEQTARINDVSKARVVEDALNKYYNI